MKAIVRNGWQRVRAGADAARGTARLVRGGLANLIFPPRCVSCNRELEAEAAGDTAICDDCLEQMEIFAGPTCDHCGAPLPFVSASGEALALPPPARRGSPGCYRCRGRKLWFDATIALGLYSGRLRDILLRMKDAEGDSLSLAMGRLLWQERGERLAALEADVVAPIPLHWRRRIAHRTNSPALITEVLSSQLGLPGAEGLLRRNRYTPRQSDVTPSERWKNMRNAFVVRAGYHLRDAHVLLVDDILTTGATCSEATRALRAAGAKRVTVVVVARAFGNL